MAGTLPPLFTITDDDHGGYVAVASYTLLVLMVLLVATRVFTRWYVVKFIKTDDILLIIAAGLGILQSVFVQLAIDHGLARARATISDSDFELYQKYEYAAQILLVAAMAFAKLSLGLLITSLMAEGFSLLASRGLLVIILGWALASIFALAFQCSVPHPWDFGGRCIDQDALHQAIAAVNILTDAGLVLLPCVVFWKVHLSKMRRYRITTLFASRIIVCVIAGLQARAFESYITSSDKTWANTSSSIWDQAMMNLSIICTAIPSLGRLILELQPAVNAFAITEQHGLSRNDRYIFSSFAGRVPRDYAMNNRLGAHTSILGSRDRERRNKEDAESTQGLREDGIRQNKNVIKQTLDFKVEYLASL